MEGGTVEKRALGFVVLGFVPALELGQKQRLATVIRVADQWAADGLEMDANLMHPPGFDDDFDKGKAAEFLADTDNAARVAAVCMIDSGMAGNFWMSAYGEVDRLTVCRSEAAIGNRSHDGDGGASMTNGNVGLTRCPVAKLADQFSERFAIPRDDEHAAGIEIETMNISQKFSRAGGLKQRHQIGPGFVESIRHGKQARRLVQCQKVIVFVKDFDGPPLTTQPNRVHARAVLTRAATRLGSTGLNSLPPTFRDVPTITPSA